MVRSVPTMPAKLAAEFLGTFILVFTVCNDINGSNAANDGLSCLSIAASLMVGIYALGSVSGANFNPAVTTGLLCADAVDHDVDMHAAQAGLYILMQLVGGFLGGLSSALMFNLNDNTMTVAPYNATVAPYNATVAPYFSLKDVDGTGTYNAGQIFGAELFYTALLVFVYLNVATCNDYISITGEKNQYFGLAIGFVIIAGATAIGHISGCSLNPAVSFGVAMNSAIFKDSVTIGKAFQQFGLYTLAELLGGVMGFGFFHGCRNHYLEHQEEAREAQLIVDPTAKPPMATHIEEAFAEFLGTFYLVLTIAFVCMSGSATLLGCLGVASALMVMIYSLAAVSGANFNPAVSVALLLIGKLPPKECAIYIVSQLLGAIVAMLVAWSIELPTSHLQFSDNSFPKQISSHSVAGGALGAIVVGELFYTSLLVFVVLNVAVADGKNQYYGLAIGGCCWGCLSAVAEGTISGGCFNPAVAFGLDFGGLWLGDANAKFGYGFLYMVIQFIGAGLAAGLFKVVRQRELSDEYEE